MYIDSSNDAIASRKSSIETCCISFVVDGRFMVP